MKFGFDRFYGFLGGMHDYFDPSRGHGNVGTDPVEGNAPVLDGTEPVKSMKYLTEELTDRAIDFVEDGVVAQKPFVLYLPYNAVHSPMQAPQEYLDRFNGGKTSRDKELAMLACLDDNIGRLLTRLDEKQLTSNTLVLFYGDNGGTSAAANG